MAVGGLRRLRGLPRRTGSRCARPPPSWPPRCARASCPPGSPGPADFAPGAPRLAQAYEEAWLACRFVAERFGEKALVRLYGSDVGSTLGLPVAEFTGAWRDYLRKELT
ncbi:hypothetical protein GCM10018952_67820 [Streptosporangium vulgare]